MSTTVDTSKNSAAYKPQVASGGTSLASRQQKLNNMFQQIDTPGTGRITKTQFEQSFNKLSIPASVKELGSEAVFNKLDPSNTGAVTKQDFVHGMDLLMTRKDSSSSKEPQIEAKPTPAPKAPVITTVTQNSPSDAPPTTEGRTIGNIINVTA
jgi:hypothetical protein